MKKSIFIILFLIASILSFAQITLVLNPGPAAGKDANIRSDHPYSNYGSSMDFIANAFTAGGEFFIQRSFIQFDLSSIPANAFITEARLSMYCNTESGHAQFQYGDNECLLQRITQNWNEQSVTWNNQPLTSEMNEIRLPASTFNIQDYPSIDITSLVRDMVLYPDESYGLMFRLGIEDAYRTMVFGSSDHASPGKWPKLAISYDSCAIGPVSFSFSVLDNLNVNFLDQSGGVTHWQWDFGDGYQSTLQNPSHTYGSEGKYKVCLKGENACSSLTYCDSISLCNSVLTDFAYTNSGDHLVSFTDSSRYPDSWFWDFGDGFYSDLQNPVHYFNSYGGYKVCLTASNSCGSTIMCHRIEVMPISVPDCKGKLMRIYPNPSNSGFNIEIAGNKKQIELVVFDMTGRKVPEINPILSGSLIRLPAMRQGIYTLVLKIDDEIYYEKLFSL